MANSWLPSVSKQSYHNLQTDYFGTVKIFLGCMHVATYLRGIFHCMKNGKKGFYHFGVQSLNSHTPLFYLLSDFEVMHLQYKFLRRCPTQACVHVCNLKLMFTIWHKRDSKTLYFHFFLVVFDGLLSKRQFLPVDLLLGILVFLGRFPKVRTGWLDRSFWKLNSLFARVCDEKINYFLRACY